MRVATRKTTQIDLRVENVQDPVVREALVQLADTINIMTGFGFTTDGFVKAAKGFNADDKTFKVKLFRGNLAATGSSGLSQSLLIVPGLITGAFGYAQYDGTTEWRLMARGSSTNSVYFENGSSNAVDRIRVLNSDASHSNGYRAVIFYTEYDQ